MKYFEDKVVKVISKLICDRCGEEAIPEDYTFHEFISINHRCGYDSIHGDGSQISIDLCQKCFADMCGDSLTVTGSIDEQGDSDLRISIRNILLANKITCQSELTIALKRLDQLWDAQSLSQVGSELYELVDLIHDYEGKSWDSYFEAEYGVSGDFMT